MFIVEPGMITRFLHLWNTRENRNASSEETEELIKSGELSVKYFEKEKMVGISLGDKAKYFFRLFEPNEK